MPFSRNIYNGGQNYPTAFLLSFFFTNKRVETISSSDSVSSSNALSRTLSPEIITLENGEEQLKILKPTFFEPRIEVFEIVWDYAVE